MIHHTIYHTIFLASIQTGGLLVLRVLQHLQPSPSHVPPLTRAPHTVDPKRPSSSLAAPSTIHAPKISADRVPYHVFFQTEDPKKSFIGAYTVTAFSSYPHMAACPGILHTYTYNGSQKNATMAHPITT